MLLHPTTKDRHLDTVRTHLHASTHTSTGDSPMITHAVLCNCMRYLQLCQWQHTPQREHRPGSHLHLLIHKHYNTTTVAKCGNAIQVINYTNLNKPMAKHIARTTCKLAVFQELPRWGHLKSDSVAVWGSVTEDKRAQGPQDHIGHTCTVN